jgi:hypothetical protein
VGRFRRTFGTAGEGFARVGANGAAMSEIEVVRHEGERAKVESWRLHVLLEAGYPYTLAERLAASEADLHRAVELVFNGCAPHTAAEILL